MLIKSYHNKPWYEFALFQEFGDSFTHGVLSRHIDVKESDFFMEILRTPHAPIALRTQLHGTQVALIDGNTHKNFQGDVLMTKTQQIPLLIRIADCSSILMYDPVQNVFANVHAGWRGFTKRIIRETMGALLSRFKCRPENMLAGISPMLGPCCSNFSDPYNEIPPFLHEYITEENTVNLWAMAEGQLRECGILQNHIENPRICTYCHPEDFFSYRRGDKEARFATVGMLR